MPRSTSTTPVDAAARYGDPVTSPIPPSSRTATSAALLLADVVKTFGETRAVVVIHHGRILFDGELASLAERFSLDKTVTARLADGEEIKVNAPRGEIATATGKLLSDHDVVDLTIEDAPIEDVIERLFAEPAT